MKNLILSLMMLGITASMSAQTYIEKLSRGVVAVPMEKGNFVSWRFLSTDAPTTSFNIIRDGEVIASNISTKTNFVDADGTPQSRYSVQTLVGGSVEDTSDEVQAWEKPYLSIPLIRPTDQTMPDGRTCSYTPNDCSTGDVDGDGDYEIILKWDPSNSHDNSHNGYSGEVFLDCYKTEGILMWRISLGKNIRAGAHYTQFMVYDFDGDGKAELICKTAPGSKDGKGDYVTNAATDESIKSADNEADYRGTNGHVLNGPEYLTVFSGKDGHAIHTIYYNPNRAFGVGGAPEYATEKWGDHGPGNRGERYLACVAFLGGKTQNPSAVMCRGYYTLSHLWAVDFDGKQLKTRWLHTSPTRSEWNVKDADGKIIAQASGLKATAFGQGAHNLSVGDVDGDGCDEIMYGSAAINNDGSLLYSTGFDHGDAQHLADLDPDRPGLEFFMVHEAKPYGCSLRDAKTGEILYRETDNDDTGRGLAGDIDASHRGQEFWCSAAKKVHAVDGSVIRETEGWTPQNFRIYWDGDLQDELVANGGRNMKPGSNPFQFGNGQRGQRRGGRGEEFQKRTAQRYYIAKFNGEESEPLTLNGKELSEWGNSASCNGTKATPCLQADLFGDWREEIILYDASDRSHLNVFTTNIPTDYRIPTLMHDHVYRMGVAWQNTSYNQPPHLGYYLPDAVSKK